MLSSSTASPHSMLSPCPVPALTIQAFLSEPRFRRTQRRFVPLSVVGAKDHHRFGLYRSPDYCRVLHCGWSGFVRRCGVWDSEGDFELEAEILEFMNNSNKPGAFPSKKELVDAGRNDLVKAIVKQGGWLSSGWDLDEEEGAQESAVTSLASTAAMESDHFQENNVRTGEEIQGPDVSYCPYDDFQSTLSSEMETTQHETGIEGILNRLEKERNLTFGLGQAENEAGRGTNNDNEDWHSKFSTDMTVAGLSRSSRSSSLIPKKAIFVDPQARLNQGISFSKIDELRSSNETLTWRTWSTQRAGFSDMCFEDIETASSESSIGGSLDMSEEEILRRESISKLNEGNELDSCLEVISHNQLRSRLKHLESELSSVLHSVRYNADGTASQKDHEGSSDDLQKLSDAWEFQENEIMNTQNLLRSTRAKLAVLEGKMALAIINAKKIAEEKQKRIDDARRAVRLLRSSCIVWPNSASEVLLAGSFDGWASQRKMIKSSTGIFSLWLQLYPGKYEIKFIVDGEWRIDPLRPIVLNNGYNNNLLIIT
ncbi:protein PTST homolog 2, chloroplastic isoform X2 [Humulus lupulus]|uniref:protein PTST homolog 2, chloroplastic isoform X2 n=1 Tax=Humulus lupulus TaxID=3486 RepID=UPI002B409A5B|nr:protein PTST homolog 2, chloroplastic isoform X2 [Humulus lupulus]